MKMIELNNGLMVPSIGYGTYPQKETLSKTAQTAYCAGYRLFDTSDNYKNEAFLGAAFGNMGISASDCVVISKFSQAHRSSMINTCFEESRTRLRGNLNLYLLHWPYPYLWKEQWRQLEKLYADKKCDGIGVCNFEVSELKELLDFCKVKPVINQIERHPLFQQQEIVGFCKENNIQVMCYSPIARHDSALFESEVLKKIAERHKKSVSQIILRWDIDTGTIPIPASGSEEHIIENISIDHFSLSNEEIMAINSLECGKRIRFDPKTRFNLKQKAKFALTKLRMTLLK